jgi:hypothetical protein
MDRVLAMNTPAITLHPGARQAADRAPDDPAAAATGPPGTCQVEIVVPVKDEEADMAPSVRRLHAFLDGRFPFTAHGPDLAGLELAGLELAGGTADAGAVIAFARRLADLADAVQPAIEAARQDKLAWIAYPKAGQVGTDLNRDTLARWAGDHGIRPVRQIALDEVWSALRFRPER